MARILAVDDSAANAEPQDQPAADAAAPPDSLPRVAAGENR